MKITLLAIGTALLIGGWFWFRSPAKNLVIMPFQEKTEAVTTGEMMENKGQYISLTSGTLVEHANERRILFFYANWCPECKAADADIRSHLNDIPQGTVILRVNYRDSDTDEEEQQLAQRYGITYQHTFVEIDADGKAIATWNGGGIEKLIKNIK